MLIHYKYIFHVISAIKSDLDTASFFFFFFFAQLAQFIITDIVSSLPPPPRRLIVRRMKLQTTPKYSEKKNLRWVSLFCK